MVISSDKTVSPFSTPMEARSNFRQALPQILAVCVKNVLLLGFGMTLGFPTILIPSLSGNNPEESFHLGQEAISWIGSINLICVPVGCLLSGVITQPIGRKRAMQLVNIPFLAAWLLFHFSTDVWQVFMALALTGFTGGLLEAPVLTYVAEITQPHLRGILSSTSSMAVIFGVLIEFLLGTFFNWRNVALTNCAIPLVAFVLLIFVPETPIWLISKNRYLDARKSIAWLRGWTSLGEIELEFQELCKQLGKAGDIGIDNPILGNTSNKSSKLEVLKLFTQKSFLWPYLLVSFTFFLGHFNGMTTLQTYAIKLFAALKSPIDKYYATIIVGLVELLGCIVCVTLIHFTGKRLINFVSLIGCGICFMIAASYTHLIDVKYLDTIPQEQDQNTNYWIPTTFLIGSAFLSHIGIKILPWILTGEVFSNETRATASGLSAAMGYVFGFTSNKIFLSMISNLTLPGTFWLYSSVSFIGAIILYFVLPETEGKTLYDITEHFAGKSKLGNEVLRNKEGVINSGFTMEECIKEILTYVAEITQPSLRGILSTSSGVAVIAGILAQFSFGTFLSWRTIALMNCVTHIASFILLFLVPESPHWLISKNRLNKAQANLAWFRGWVSLEEVKIEFDELCRQMNENQKKTKMNLLDNFRLYKEKKFWWPFSLVGFAFFLSHFTGTLPVQVYAVKIFATLHSPIDKYYATVMLGVAELIGCILTTCIVHCLGKRMLSFLSLISCGICFLIVASFAYSSGIVNLNLNEDLNDPRQDGWIPMSCLIGAFFFTHIGIKHLPWLLIGEVYHTEIRTMASGLSAAFSYILSFVASKIFLSMISLLTFPGTFWFYSGVCFFGTVVLYFVLPETEGKTLYDITQHFANNLKLNNKVLRHKNTFGGNPTENKGYVDNESRL